MLIGPLQSDLGVAFDRGLFCEMHGDGLVLAASLDTQVILQSWTHVSTLLVKLPLPLSTAENRCWPYGEDRLAERKTVLGRRINGERRFQEGKEVDEGRDQKGSVVKSSPKRLGPASNRFRPGLESTMNKSVEGSSEVPGSIGKDRKGAACSIRLKRREWPKCGTFVRGLAATGMMRSRKEMEECEGVRGAE